MTVFSKTSVKRGKSAIEPTYRPTQNMNMSGCFILVPFRGKINLGPRPQNKIVVLFKGGETYNRVQCYVHSGHLSTFIFRHP